METLNFSLFNFANTDIDQVLIRAVQNPSKTEKSIEKKYTVLLGLPRL